MDKNLKKEFNCSSPNTIFNLEWLMTQLYPRGIQCPRCKKNTKHHRVSKRSCYACDVCGHQIYPTVGTVFYKSHIPIRTWFNIMQDISAKNGNISVREIQRKYGINYKTARRLLQKSREFLTQMEIKFSKNKAEYPFLESLDLGGIDKQSQGNNLLVEKKRKDLQNSDQHYRKRDKIARLMKLEIILSQSPNGMNIEEISSKTSVSKRTVYRDLSALEEEIGVPIWEKDGKRGIVEGYALPPIHFSSQEAMRIFLALRLILNYSHVYDPAFEAAFMKLNTIVPWPLKHQIQNCLQYMAKLPKNEKLMNNIDILTQSWFSKKRVKFDFQEISDEKPIGRTFEIYLIEPGLWGHSTYLIGYCHHKKSLYFYKTDRIIGDVRMQSETYEVPTDFDPSQYLEANWNTTLVEEKCTIKLLFNPRLSAVLKNTIWHPSQRLQYNDDSSILMTLRVRNTLDFRSWIYGWEDDVEVLEPESLRTRIFQVSKKLGDIYKKQDLYHEKLESISTK